MNYLEKLFKARLAAQMETFSLADIISIRSDKKDGATVRFPVAKARGAIKDYKGTPKDTGNGEAIKWDDVGSDSIELLMNQKKYFADIVDDLTAKEVDKKEVIDLSIAKNVRALTITEDEFVLNEAISKSGKQIQRTLKSPEDFYNALVDANKELSKNYVPEYGRYFVISFDYLGMLEKDKRFTSKYERMENGLLKGAQINGTPLIVTNSLPENKALAIQKEGLGFERFISKTTIIPELESRFGSGIRALNVYDSKVLDKDRIVVVNTVEKVEETK